MKNNTGLTTYCRQALTTLNSPFAQAPLESLLSKLFQVAAVTKHLACYLRAYFLVDITDSRISSSQIPQEYFL